MALTKKEQQQYTTARKMTDAEARFVAKTDGRFQGNFGFLGRRGEPCEFDLSSATITRLTEEKVSRG